jgi:hypothetical protein
MLYPQTCTETLTYSFPVHSSSCAVSNANVVTGVNGLFGEGPGNAILAVSAHSASIAPG